MRKYCSTFKNTWDITTKCNVGIVSVPGFKKIIKRHLVGILKIEYGQSVRWQQELFSNYVLCDDCDVVRQEKALNISKENVIKLSGDKMTQYLKFTLKYNKKGKKRNRWSMEAQFGWWNIEAYCSLYFYAMLKKKFLIIKTNTLETP